MFFKEFSFNVITHTSHSKGRILFIIIKVIKNKSISKRPVITGSFIVIGIAIFLFICIDIYILIKGVFRVFRGFYGRFRFLLFHCSIPKRSPSLIRFLFSLPPSWSSSPDTELFAPSPIIAALHGFLPTIG